MSPPTKYSLKGGGGPPAAFKYGARTQRARTHTLDWLRVLLRTRNVKRETKRDTNNGSHSPQQDVVLSNQVD